MDDQGRHGQRAHQEHDAEPAWFHGRTGSLVVAHVGIPSRSYTTKLTKRFSAGYPLPDEIGPVCFILRSEHAQPGVRHEEKHSDSSRTGIGSEGTLLATALVGRGNIVRSIVRRITREPLAAKVPEITALFWALKLLTTAAGEATSDYLSTHNRVVGAFIEIVLLVVALGLQFGCRRYFAPAYWFLALAIAIAATGLSDAMHLTVGIPYAGTTAFWAVLLAIIFWQWHRSERTLSIHSITTRRRELYYWSTVFATFALGTALGDLTATTLGLGYLASAFVFIVVIVIPAIGWWRFRLNAVFAFWFAYVVTRPIGASFADYFSKPHELSGANFGDGPTAVVGVIAVAILTVYVSIARVDIQPAADQARDSRSPETP